MSADNVTNMLSTTRQIEDIYVSQRIEDLDQLASGKVTLHKDSITLGADIQGIDNLKKYYQVMSMWFAALYPSTLQRRAAQCDLIASQNAGFLQEV